MVFGFFGPTAIFISLSIWSSDFLFIQPSGFSLLDQLERIPLDQPQGPHPRFSCPPLARLLLNNRLNITKCTILLTFGSKNISQSKFAGKIRPNFFYKSQFLRSQD